MRVFVLICAALVLGTTGSVAQEGVPIDECGILFFNPVEGGCWTFNGYEIYGDFTGFGHGDRVRVIGTYTPGFSFCMIGNCCLLADSVSACESCCVGRTGNADGSWDDDVVVSDLTTLVSMIFQDVSVRCPEECDVNGSGDLNVSDLTYLVDFLFRGGPQPAVCP